MVRSSRKKKNARCQSRGCIRGCIEHRQGCIMRIRRDTVELRPLSTAARTRATAPKRSETLRNAARVSAKSDRTFRSVAFYFQRANGPSVPSTGHEIGTPSRLYRRIPRSKVSPGQHGNANQSKMPREMIYVAIVPIFHGFFRHRLSPDACSRKKR